MAQLSTAQRQYVRKRTRVHDLDPSETAGEINIIPFLDIVINIIMFMLATTIAIIQLTQLDSELPELRRGVGSGQNRDNPLNLNVTITPNGVIVAGSGGKLAPGCQTTVTGSVMTIPRLTSGYDWPALTQCLVRVKAQYADEDQVIVSADPMIQYEHVVAAMDAVRANGTDLLFPTILISGGVR